MPWPVHPTGFLASRGDEDSYKIERSLRFNSADSAYLSRTPASAGDRKTWTWSGWVKRGKLGVQDFIIFNEGGVSSNYLIARFASGGSGDIIEFFGSAGAFNKTTNQVFRDTSAWYHLVFVMDATNTQARIYVNGVEASYSTNTNPSNTDQNFNRAQETNIGRSISGTQHFDGYLTEIHFIDGQALTPSSFGETDAITGRWKAKAYSGTYGTNGFYLSFKNNTSTTTLGYDDAGSNDWTLNNFSVTAGSDNDSLLDSPTNSGTSGNYCTLDALSKDLRKIAQATFSASLTNGNLDWTNTATSVSGGCPSTMAASYKCYFEATINTLGNENTIGISDISTDWMGIGGVPISGLYCWATSGGFYGNGTTNLPSKPTATTNDVLMVAYNPENGKIWFGKNGTWNGSGDPSSGINEAFTISNYLTQKVPFVLGYQSASFSLNFGQRPFAYTAPTGFKALCTTNLPTPTIKKPSKYMDVVTYTGTGSALTPTSSLGFSPDLVWVKGRSGATDHALYDAVRGAEKRLESNNTDTEVTSDGGVTAFNSNGFTLGTLAQVNTSSATYVAWAWDEAPIAGMDIVSYTGNSTAGRSISHSLGVSPKMIIVKNRSISENWPVWHTSLGSNQLYLNLTNAAGSGDISGINSSSFTISAWDGVNGNTNLMIAYLFAEVEGFSKFGSYTGNGSSDGPFVWCGFRPRWVMIKRSDASSTYSNWYICDSARDTFNVGNNFLNADTAKAENIFTDNSGGSFPIDFLSNGFKYRLNNSGGDVNASGGTYIFAAFAESAFKYSRAR